MKNLAIRHNKLLFWTSQQCFFFPFILRRHSQLWCTVFTEATSHLVIAVILLQQFVRIGDIYIQLRFAHAVDQGNILSKLMFKGGTVKVSNDHFWVKRGGSKDLLQHEPPNKSMNIRSERQSCRVGFNKSRSLYVRRLQTLSHGSIQKKVRLGMVPTSSEALM